MCACTHCYINISYIEYVEAADELTTSKNTDLTRFFIIKPRHTGGLKNNRSGWKKPSVGALVTCGKRPTSAT